MNLGFYMPTKVIVGKDCVRENSDVFKIGKKALIVTGKNSAKLSGALDDVKYALEKNNIEYVIFDKVMSNPTVECVYDGAETAMEEEVDFVIAIGGGSPMDSAKAIALLAVSDIERKNLFDGNIGNKALPMIHIPTTAGTGSETTLAAVITDADTHHKYAINDFNLIPDYAVLEPSVTYGLPPQLTATTGMDALTHAIEAYIGRSTTKQTRAASIEAIQLIFDNLQTAYKNGNDKTARRNMLRASYLAGTAFTKSYVGYVHAVAHSLGGCYGIPHGLANSVLLPIVLKAYGTAAHKKLARLARITGISDSKLDAVAAEEFINHIRNMNISMNIPETLDGIRNEDIPKLACYADKEANPLYPVPALWGPEKLEQMYHLVQEVSEHDRNRNSEHPGKAA